MKKITLILLIGLIIGLVFVALFWANFVPEKNRIEITNEFIINDNWDEYNHAIRIDKMTVLSLGDTADSYAINEQKFTDFETYKTEILKTVKNNPDNKMIIAGDRSVSLERLLSVLTFLNDNGIQTANILMQSGDQK